MFVASSLALNIFHGVMLYRMVIYVQAVSVRKMNFAVKSNILDPGIYLHIVITVEFHLRKRWDAATHVIPKPVIPRIAVPIQLTVLSTRSCLSAFFFAVA